MNIIDNNLVKLIMAIGDELYNNTKWWQFIKKIKLRIKLNKLQRRYKCTRDNQPNEK